MNGDLTGMMEFTQTEITWIILWFFQLFIAVYFIQGFQRSQDKRKVMFGIALLVLSINHLYFGFIVSFFDNQVPLILQNLQIWAFFPIVCAIGFAVHNSLFQNKDFNKVFMYYVALVSISFPLLLFNPLSIFSMLAIFGITIEIGCIALFNTIRWRGLNDVIILLAVFSFFIGEFTISQQSLSLSIFSLFTATIFITLLFAIPQQIHYKKKSSMSEFFTLQQELKQTKKELSEQEKTFQTLFDEMVDPVMILDRKGTFLEVTRRVKEYTGYAREELLGKSFMNTKLLSRKAKMVCMANLVKRMSGMHVPPYEVMAIKKDGTSFPIEINARRTVYKGKPADMVVIRDISERKQMEQELVESEKKYRDLFTNLRDAFAKVDMQGKIIECNPAFEEMLGYTLSELQQLTYNDITPMSWHVRESKILQEQVLKRGYSDLYKKEYRGKNGEIFPVELTTYLIKNHDGKPVGMWALVRDISEREAYEKEIHELNANLEQKVKERTYEVESLLEQKNEFIHLLAHDLKNPLATPLTLLPIVKQKNDNFKVHEIIDASLRNIKKIQQLINETLDLARIDDTSSTLHQKTMNLHDFMEKVERDNQDLLKKYDFHIEKSIPSSITIWADTFQLGEVMNNLISNAVKYTQDSDKRIIYIDAKESKEEVTISVSDKGQGIPAEKQKQLFERFYKTGSPREGMNSTGLGLSLCKSIIEKHGGKIWVESHGSGKGSTFSFMLPKKKTYRQGENTNLKFVSIRKNIDDLLKKYH